MPLRLLTKIKATTAMRRARPTIPPPTAPTIVPVPVAETGVLVADATEDVADVDVWETVRIRVECVTLLEVVGYFVLDSWID